MAATLVVVSHARDVLVIDYPGKKPWLPFYALTGLGHSAVIVFFVLSGFWISRSVLGRIDQPSFWPGYLIARLSRLGIVLVPALLLGGLLDAVGMGLLHLPIYQGVTGAHSVATLANRLTPLVLLGNLAFLQTIAVDPWGSNGPLWSLAFEFWYYMWFPVLALSWRRRRPSPALLALLIGVLNPALYWGFVSWLVGLGLLLRVAEQPDPITARAVGPARLALAACLFAGVLAATGIIKRGWIDVPLALSFALLLLAVARNALPFPVVLAPLASYGRNASFSLYAIHFPVVALVGGWVIGRARLMPGPWSLLLVLMLTGLCLLVGRLFAHLGEAYTERLRDWLRLRLLTPARPERA